MSQRRESCTLGYLRVRCLPWSNVLARHLGETDDVQEVVKEVLRTHPS
jgi:hypothetical protein